MMSRDERAARGLPGWPLALLMVLGILGVYVAVFVGLTAAALWIGGIL